MDHVSTEWRKSTYSGGNGGDCVEVARSLPRAIAIRDSKDPDGPKLVVSAAAWQHFTAGLSHSAG
jgi:Domain of unknown function (DUF397)